METVGRGGARERSPNYPSIGLPEAIKDTKALWEREKRTAVSPEIAARAWGYKSLSGPARSTIGALKQYGLLESTRAGLALTQLAVDILHNPEGSPAWLESVKVAADYPDLFRELGETHSSASEDAIKAYLITRRRFSEDGAKRATKAFKETMALANRVSEGYSKADTATTSPVRGDAASPQVSGIPQTIGNAKVTSMVFLLAPGMQAEVRFIGGDVEPSHITTLAEYLEIAGKALGKAPKATLDRPGSGGTN